MTSPSISSRRLERTSRGTSLDNRDQTFALSEVATLSPNTANEARFQYTHSRLVAPANDLTGPAITISGAANIGTSTSSPTGEDVAVENYKASAPLELGL